MTREILQERQSWSLEQKIDHSMGVIEEFYRRLDGKVYVGFSGGKDSTVLLWLVRKMYKDVKAVFCNTGNEYPDIVYFVRKMQKEDPNIEIIRPKLRPPEVMEKYGFPLVSKETSGIIHDVRYNPESVRSRRAMGLIEGTKYLGRIPEMWKFLIDESFMTSNACCRKLKKEPFHSYERRNGVSPMLGTLASESNQRTNDYVNRGGCNVFSDGKYATSKSAHLSIWLESDILECIDKFGIEISEIYSKGAERTGCMFCGYGCHFKDDNRLQLVYDLYPKWYEKFMGYTNNGVTYREALRKVLDIKGISLPDEKNELFK